MKTFFEWMESTVDDINNLFTGNAEQIANKTEQTALEYAKRILNGEDQESILNNVNPYMKKLILKKLAELQGKTQPQQISIRNIESSMGLRPGKLSIENSNKSPGKVVVRIQGTNSIKVVDANENAIKQAIKEILGLV